MTDALIVAIAATAELCGTQLSKPAAAMLADDLSRYPEPAVMDALKRCRHELKGRLTVAEVVSRIEDGRPSADEAWGLLPWDEAASAVMSEEMSLAMGVARVAYLAGDKYGARMAFRDAYTRAVNDARQAGRPPEWFPSLGYDRAGRAAALTEAVSKGRMTLCWARRVLPEMEGPAQEQARGIEGAAGMKAVGQIVRDTLPPK